MMSSEFKGGGASFDGFFVYPPNDLEPKNIYVPLKRMAPFQGDAARTVGNPPISGRLL